MNEWVVGFVSRDEVFANYINEVGQCLSADHEEAANVEFDEWDEEQKH